MSEIEPSQIQDLTADALRQVLQYVQEGEGFVREQAPLVVQEMVMWGIVHNLIVAACLLLLILPFLVVVVVSISGGIKCMIHNDDENAVCNIVIGGIAFLPAMIVCTYIGQFSMAALQAYIAPRLYVIERLSELLN